MMWVSLQVLQDPQWPDSLPFEPDDFRRFDESKDTYFYSQVDSRLYFEAPFCNTLQLYVNAHMQEKDCVSLTLLLY